MMVKLTFKQASLISWALSVALSQQRKFLMHDDWEAGMSKQGIDETLRIERELIVAGEAFDWAFKKALGDK